MTTDSDAEAIAKKLKDKPKDQDACLREIGYARVYRYLQPGFFDCESGKAQLKRIRQLELKIAVNWRTPDPGFWEHMYGEIIDEIENMC